MPHRVFDHVQIRCPSLGGQVTFGYCREVSDGLPCHKALLCFDRQFPVAEYFRRVLHADTYERCFTAPTGCRYEKILGVLEHAQQTVAQDRDTPDHNPDHDPDHDPDD